VSCRQGTAWRLCGRDCSAVGGSPRLAAILIDAGRSAPVLDGMGYRYRRQRADV
jgi:hypothetical protein